MIFSLSKSTFEYEISISNQIDIYCFFTVKNSVSLPVSALKNAILASLKLKKEVLLLRKADLPAEISKNLQWDGDDHWLWLSPRSASIISRSWDNSAIQSLTFNELISKLKSSK